ncbi:hypothetical protein, partial [Citrobacter freundii]|uniref:hypothetical protein n=2 Tax=Citrobacter freundii TaxID=546 RepID=UPI001CD22765
VVYSLGRISITEGLGDFVACCKDTASAFDVGIISGVLAWHGVIAVPFNIKNPKEIAAVMTDFLI